VLLLFLGKRRTRGKKKKHRSSDWGTSSWHGSGGPTATPYDHLAHSPVHPSSTSATNSMQEYASAATKPDQQTTFIQNNNQQKVTQETAWPNSEYGCHSWDKKLHCKILIALNATYYFTENSSYYP